MTVLMMMIGDLILGTYKIIDLFPEGGQAYIAQGRHQSTGELVLIKKLKLSPAEPNYTEELARFQRAGKLRIEHSNVIDPLEMGEENGEWYLVFPFVECQELGTYVVAHSGHVPVSQARSIIIDIATGLQAIHSKNIVHRDLKPDNILVRIDGTACIIDLGICRIVTEATITNGSGFLGTYQWLSPEQAANPSTVDCRSDLHALGALLYFLLTGKPPFEGPDAPIILQNICLQSPIPPRQLNSAIPEELNQACLRLLEKDPARRFQTATEFINAVTGNSSTPANACTACGVTLPTGSSFCVRCGASLSCQTLASCFACGRAVGNDPECSGCRRLFSPSNHRFEFHAGTLAGRMFRIPEGIYTVGRGDIAPNDYCISRRQIQVGSLNGVVHVEDAGSANPCLLDGRPITRPTPLSSGQQISLAGNIGTYRTS